MYIHIYKLIDCYIFISIYNIKKHKKQKVQAEGGKQIKTSCKLPSLHEIQSSFNSQQASRHGGATGPTISLYSSTSTSTFRSTSKSIDRMTSTSQSNNANTLEIRKGKEEKPKSTSVKKKFVPPQLTSKKKNVNTEDIG